MKTGGCGTRRRPLSSAPPPPCREASVGQHKAHSAAAACAQLNSLVRVETHLQGFTPANAVALVRQYDVVVDASDNAPTRYLIRWAGLMAGGSRGAWWAGQGHSGGRQGRSGRGWGILERR